MATHWYYLDKGTTHRVPQSWMLASTGLTSDTTDLVIPDIPGMAACGVSEFEEKDTRLLMRVYV